MGLPNLPCTTPALLFAKTALQPREPRDFLSKSLTLVPYLLPSPFPSECLKSPSPDFSFPICQQSYIESLLVWWDPILRLGGPLSSPDLGLHPPPPHPHILVLTLVPVTVPSLPPSGQLLGTGATSVCLTVQPLWEAGSSLSLLLLLSPHPLHPHNFGRPPGDTTSYFPAISQPRSSWPLNNWFPLGVWEERCGAGKEQQKLGSASKGRGCLVGVGVGAGPGGGSEKVIQKEQQGELRRGEG